MSDLSEIVEQELETAFEVKDRKALHRYVVLVTQGVMRREEADQRLAKQEAQTNERFLRLENDIQSLTQAMREGFASVDKRFEAVENRFEAVDRRFEAMEKRFEAIDKRFDDLIHHMDKRFDAVEKRFEAVDKRFEDVNKRFAMVFAFMSIGFTALTVVTVLFRFWA